MRLGHLARHAQRFARRLPPTVLRRAENGPRGLVIRYELSALEIAPSKHGRSALEPPNKLRRSAELVLNDIRRIALNR